MSSQVASIGLQILIGLASVPLLLGHWGAEAYAAWLVAAALAEIVGFFDGNLQPWIGNGLALAHQSGDRSRLRRLAGIASSIYGTAFAIAAGLAGLLLLPEGSWLQAGVLALVGPASAVLLPWFILVMAVQLPSGALCAVHRCHDRPQWAFHLMNLRKLLAFLVLLVLVVSGWTPLAVVTALVFVHALFTVGIAWDLYRRYGAGLRRPLWPNRQERREIIAQGGLYNLQALATYGMTQGMVVLLGRTGSDAAVIVFTTLRTMVGLARQIAIQLALGPALERARLIGRGRRFGLGILTRATLWQTLICMAVPLGVLVAIGEPLHHLWVNGAVIFDPIVFACLVLWCALSGCAIALSHGFMLTNRPAPIALLQALGAMVALAVCFLAGPALGAAAGALALLLGEGLVAGPLMIRAALRDTGGRMVADGDGLSAVRPPVPLRRLVSLAILSAAVGGLSAAIAGMVYAGLADRLGGAWSMALTLAVWAVPMGPLTLWLVAASPARRRLLLSLVRRRLSCAA